MLRQVVEAGFQYKNGAAFARDGQYTKFDFRQKFSEGWGSTYQVQRADFDNILAGCAASAGAEVRFRHEVLLDRRRVRAAQRGRACSDGEEYRVEAKFLLDASGFARILPRMLKLETPSRFPVRGALFTHVKDGIPLGEFDRNKILVTVHPQHKDVWFWTIPFSNGRCSLGVVARLEYLEQYRGTDTECLQQIVAEDPGLSTLLAKAEWDTPARRITGYSANVASLWGKNYALLGNAGEFLDPVFSSGVTIAFKSASLAAACLQRQFAGESVDWQKDYGTPLRDGVDAFRSFVESWYAGGFQDIIFHQTDPAGARDDLLDPRRLRLGQEESVRRRHAPPEGPGRALRRLIASLAFAAALCGCAPASPRIALGELPVLHLSPASLGHELALQQHLQVGVGERSQSVDALLEVDAKELRLGMQAMGQSAMTLRWDGRRLEEQRADWLPPVLNGERVLFDLQLVLWPAPAIRAALPAGWTLQEAGGARQLLQGSTEVATVAYPPRAAPC
jgi:flavin-dependent dehydrogenase